MQCGFLVLQCSSLLIDSLSLHRYMYITMHAHNVYDMKIIRDGKNRRISPIVHIGVTWYHH